MLWHQQKQSGELSKRARHSINNPFARCHWWFAVLLNVVAPTKSKWGAFKKGEAFCRISFWWVSFGIVLFCLMSWHQQNQSGELSKRGRHSVNNPFARCHWWFAVLLNVVAPAKSKWGAFKKGEAFCRISFWWVSFGIVLFCLMSRHQQNQSGELSKSGRHSVNILLLSVIWHSAVLLNVMAPTKTKWGAFKKWEPFC